nr:hypothetical protein B0A51_11158 [Rachicladosporium sp. CCFEE 5018]
MAKPKKITPKDPKQARLLIAQPTPAITRMISQYGVLVELCKCMSSADIVNLAATCREHRKYISSNSDLLKVFMDSSHCDGSGLIAQQKIFGIDFGEGVDPKTRCLGYDAKPCVDCGAKVCTWCRFHVFYSGAGDDCMSRWFEHRMCELISYRLDDLEVDERCAVQIIKAKEMFHNWRRTQLFCSDCQPLKIANPRVPENDCCKCTIYCCLVEPWRCIPCFTILETKSICSEQKVRITFGGTTDSIVETKTRTERGYSRTVLCDCGKDVMAKSCQACRTCGLLKGWPPELTRIMKARINSQLGGVVPSRSDDVLSQLG